MMTVAIGLICNVTAVKSFDSFDHDDSTLLSVVQNFDPICMLQRQQRHSTCAEPLLEPYKTIL